jgi:hypothetical protein
MFALIHSWPLFVPSYLSSRLNERSRIEKNLYRTYFPILYVGPESYKERCGRRGKSHFVEKADVIAIGENLFDIWFRQVLVELYLLCSRAPAGRVICELLVI